MSESERTDKIYNIIKECDGKFLYEKSSSKYRTNLNGKTLLELSKLVALLEDKAFVNKEYIARLERQMNKEHLAIELSNKEGVKIANILEIARWHEQDYNEYVVDDY